MLQHILLCGHLISHGTNGSESIIAMPVCFCSNGRQYITVIKVLKSLCVSGMNVRNVHINKVYLQYNHSLSRGCPTPVFDDDYHALSCSQT